MSLAIVLAKKHTHIRTTNVIKAATTQSRNVPRKIEIAFKDNSKDCMQGLLGRYPGWRHVGKYTKFCDVISVHKL